MERFLRTENAGLTENVTWCQERLVSASAGYTEVWCLERGGGWARATLHITTTAQALKGQPRWSWGWKFPPTKG